MLLIDGINLIKKIGYHIEPSFREDIIKNQREIPIGSIKKDNRGDTIYEFSVKNKQGQNVTIYLKLGSSKQLIFLEEDGRVISFSVYEDSLQLIMPFDDKIGDEHVLIKGDKVSSLRDYLGTNYIYQAEYRFSNSQSTANVTTYFDYVAFLESPFKVKLKYHTSKEETGEKDMATSIRKILENDTLVTNLFKRFQQYLQNTFVKVPTFDILQLMLQEKITKNDVLVTPFKEFNEVSEIPKLNEIKELGDNILFGIVYKKVGEEMRAYAKIIYDLKEVYDFGYITSSRKSCYYFSCQYIFKIDEKGNVARVFDFLNKLEISDDNIKNNLYKEIRKAKIKKRTPRG